MQNVDKDLARILQRADFENFSYSTEWMAISTYLQMVRVQCIDSIISTNDAGMNRFNAGEIKAIDSFLQLPKSLAQLRNLAIEEERRNASKDKEEGE